MLRQGPACQMEGRRQISLTTSVSIGGVNRRLCFTYPWFGVVHEQFVPLRDISLEATTCPRRYVPLRAAQKMRFGSELASQVALSKDKAIVSSWA